MTERADRKPRSTAAEIADLVLLLATASEISAIAVVDPERASDASGVRRYNPVLPYIPKQSTGNESAFPISKILVMQPVGEAFDPIVDGTIVLGHSKTMTAGSIDVEFSGSFGRSPGQVER